MNSKTVYIKTAIIFLFFSFSSVVSAKQTKESSSFNFFINADPQMGEQNTKNKRLQNLNTLLSSFVKEVNSSASKPDFVVWNGDLVWKPNQSSFDNFSRIVASMKTESKLVHGNHDGIEGDKKFFELQKKLMGFEKLHYSFDHKNWHFVVIGSQEKYPKKHQKHELLSWLKNDLNKNKDKPTMLFMHYHILPPGLSQMEFYTFYPMSFKNQLLDTITEQGSVKYVFSGHVHIGVKASIKTAMTYKNTTFVLPPSPVPARPFGEEFEYYDQPGHDFDDKGYYLEVQVKGDDVSLIGHKINHPKTTPYPKKDLKQFSKNTDARAFKSESEFSPNDQLLNGNFTDQLKHWYSSWRYQADKMPAFSNIVQNGSNFLTYNSKYGYWAKDEYFENFQVIKYQPQSKLTFEFELPEPIKGGGGYFRLFGYQDNKLKNIGLLHWGDTESKVKYMHQSWAYNATGNRKHPFWLNKGISSQQVNSYTLNPKVGHKHSASIDIDNFLQTLDTPITKVGIAYGIWGRVNGYGTHFESSLKVNKISINKIVDKTKHEVYYDGKPLTTKDTILSYGHIYKQKSQ